MQGQTLQIQAVFKYPDGSDPGAEYSVTGEATTANNGLLRFTGDAEIRDGKLWTDWMSSSVPFTADMVQFFNPLEIKWTISVNGAAAKDAGTTQTPIYVCLKGIGPNPSGETTAPWRTLVHLACSVGNATTTQQAVANSFSQLEGRTFSAWNPTQLAYTRHLFYYKSGVSAGGNAGNLDIELLLNQYSTGQCKPWASLLYGAASLNWKDVSVNIQMIKLTSPFSDANNIRAIMMNEWTPNQFPDQVKTLTFNGAPPEMLPSPTDPQLIYGDFRYIGMDGQNSPIPQEAVFGFHMVVKISFPAAGEDAIYYDPSYGEWTPTLSNLQSILVNGFQTGAIVGNSLSIIQSDTPLVATVDT